MQSAIRTIIDYNYPLFELLVVHDTERRGSSKARNFGLRLAEGDFVHFAEDDCEYARSNLRYLVDKYVHTSHSDSRTAGVVGSLLPPVWGSPAVMIHISTSPDGVKVSPILGEGRTDYLATGNALCSKKAIMQCGGFNEGYPHIFEDLELSLVLKRSGFTLYTCVKAIAEHKNEPRLEPRGRLFKRTAYLRGRNAALLHKSWCGNPILYVLKHFKTDLRHSIRHLSSNNLGTPPKRIAERNPKLDRFLYALGTLAGLVSKTGRKII